MSDLIDRQKVFDKLSHTRPEVGADASKERFRFLQWFADKNAIKEVPSAERTGKWKYERHEDAPMLFKDRWFCSACGDWNTYGTPKYCPNCGAKMEPYKEAEE